MSFLNIFFFINIVLLFNCGESITEEEPHLDRNDEFRTATNIDYTFLRDGSTSVSYSGQTIRISMIDQMADKIDEGIISPITAVMLSNMFANADGNGGGGLTNISTKNIVSKIAENHGDAFKSATLSYFYALFNSVEISSTSAVNGISATEGTAGILSDGGSKTILVDEKGRELKQIFQKSIIGALLVDQICYDYCLVDNLNEDDNDSIVLGKNYTEMEHHWDEGFGYFNAGNTQEGFLMNAADDNYLTKYALKIQDHHTGFDREKIYANFIKGRFAIIQKNYRTRDDAASDISYEIAIIVGARAVYYLHKTIEVIENRVNPTNPTAAELYDQIHNLSEGCGFIYSLRFIRNHLAELVFSSTESDGWLEQINNQTLYADSNAEVEVLSQIASAIESKINSMNQ